MNIRTVSESELWIQINRNRGIGGAFVILLHCSSRSCEDVTYNTSIYITTYSEKSSTYNISYASGYYELYAYDTKLDGEVLFTDDISYSIPSRHIYLSYMGASRSK